MRTVLTVKPIGLWVMALGLLTLLAILQPTNVNAETPETTDVGRLTQELERQSQSALARGAVESTRYGLTFTSQTANELEVLHQRASDALEASLARTPQERQKAEIEIQSWFGTPDIDVVYQSTAWSSYEGGRLSEFYTVGSYYVEVDQATDHIIQVGPYGEMAAPTVALGEANKQYDVTELGGLALAFATMQSALDLDVLTYQEGNKGGQTHFFRWEDQRSA